ncbi:MAG: polysaccharide biosynthesis tyrosine autokinase [Bacteroidota bacterium]
MIPSNSSSLQQQTIDFGYLLKPVLKYWYVITFSTVLSVVFAFLYLRSVTPIYEAQSTILIRNHEENGLTREALQKEMLEMSSNPKIYEDVRILRSRMLMQAVVDSLNLRHRLLRVQQFGTADLHNNSPIDMDKIIVPNRSQNYTINIIDASSYILHLDETLQLNGTFGSPLNTEQGTFLLNFKEDALNSFNPFTDYILKTNTSFGSALVHLGAFSVISDPQKPTLLDLFIKDEVPERGLEILDQVVKAYNRITLEDKSRNRKNTLNFIDERIALLATELNEAERELESYKTKENLSVDYKSDLPYIQNQISYFERKLVDIEIEQSTMDYIAKILNSNEYQFFPLADFGSKSQGLKELITRYNNLIQEKSRLKQTVTDSYPTVQLVDTQIRSLKISILEEVAKNQQELSANVKELKQKNQSYVSELSATPRRERELINKKRQQLTKENLYKYLLEKREEAAISIAATAESARMIDAPFVIGQVAPNQNSTLLGAALGGLCLPYSVLLLLTFFDKRLRYKDEVKSYTNVPVLGSVVRDRGKSKIAIQDNNHSPSAESFRSLRTNLNFFLEDAKNQVIVVTSTTIQEGKSFTSINLGLSYALSSKKVLLIDCDLRNPKMLRYLDVKRPSSGLSNYLIGQVDTSEIIHSYENNEYLHYIGSGSIPSNPSELLTSERLPRLLEKLKLKYDLIILDSPAAGLVSDSISLSKFANASLYIARIGITEKEDLKLVEQLKEEGKLTNPTIVFNGVKKGKTYKRALRHGYFKQGQDLLN